MYIFTNYIDFITDFHILTITSNHHMKKSSQNLARISLENKKAFFSAGLLSKADMKEETKTLRKKYRF